MTTAYEMDVMSLGMIPTGTAVGPFYIVSMSGEVKDPTHVQPVVNSEINHS